MLKNFFETYNQIDGDIQTRLVSSISDNSTNLFNSRPLGIIISDTFNNPIFSFDYPEVDISRESLHMILTQYKTFYAKDTPIPMLPWHYVIEFSSIGNYILYNTRPINIKYPLNSKQCNSIIESNNIELYDDMTKDFFKTKEIEDYIHVCIIGSSFKDVYTKFIYELIGRYVIKPYSRIYRFPPVNGQGVYMLNMGDKFRAQLLDFYDK
jgi:hypothetical protein